MLRFLVLALLLANAGYYAWAQGLLRDWGMAPAQQAEPQRLAQQIRPDALRLPLRKAVAPMPAAPPPPDPAPAAEPQTPGEPGEPRAAASEPVAASPAGECLQAGVFDEEQAQAVRRAAAVLPQGSWVLQRTTIPGRWMVYIGRITDADTLARKRAELRELGVPFDRPNNASLEPGLALGRFSTEEAAQRGLGNLTAKGVRTARVVQERPDAPGYLLRLPAVDGALRAQLPALRAVLGNKTLRPCA